MLLDDILVEIGEFKTYQIIAYVMLNIVSIMTGWQHVSITFLGADMDHWCRVPQLSNLTHDMQRDISIPMETIDDELRYSQCSYYAIDYDNYTYEDFLSWDRGSMVGNTTPTEKCSSWVYDQTEFSSTALREWNLVCSDNALLATIQTVYMAGVLVGCLAFGQLSDAIGRRRTLLVSTLLWVAFALAATFVENYVAFVVLRFIVGACAAGAYTTVFVICMEIIGPSYRMETGIFVQGWFALGIMTLSGLSYIIRDFRQLQLVLAVCPLIFIAYYWIFPESPRWLVTEGRDEDAEDVLKFIAKINGTKLPADLNLAENRTGKDQEKKAVMFDLFKTPRMRLITISMWFSWFATSIVYYGLSLGVSLLEGSLFFNNFLTGIVEIPAYFATIIVVKKIGRRWPLVVTFIASGLFCILSIPFLNNPDQEEVLITSMMLGKAFGSAAFAILYVYAAELFPTVLRNVGVGSSSMCARAGGLIQPQIALLDSQWAPAPFLAYGVVSVLGGIVSLVFPETLGKKLPETLEEAENFGKKNNVKPEDVEQNGKTFTNKAYSDENKPNGTHTQTKL